MPQRPDKPISTDRRGFFRQLFTEAIKTVEEAGKIYAQRAKLHLPAVPPPPVIPAPQDSRRSQYSSSWEMYGPPWPPTYGPHVPLWLRKKLREEREAAMDGRVSRADNPEAGEAARMEEA
jgi:hypothetical protein